MNELQVCAICEEHGITVSLAGFVREADVARVIGVTVRTLQNWRRDSCGPACVRMGGAWRYSTGALAEFMTPKVKQRRTAKASAIAVSDEQELAREDAAVTAQKVAAS